MWITIEQIQCLKTVNDSGSINAASEQLNKAKSAVSYSINKLEEQLGFPLLDRSEYRIKLTPKGTAFLQKATPLLEQMDQLRSDVHQIASGLETQVAISATAIYPTGTITRVIKKLMLDFPSTEFTFHREILSGEQMLQEDKVDIAIFENLQNSLDLDHKKIDSIELLLVLAANHPFMKLKKSEQTLDQLIPYPHIIQRSTIPNSFSIGIPEQSKRWTVSDIDSKKELILNGLGWGRLPDHFVIEELKSKELVHLKHLNYDHRLDIYICKKKHKPFGPVLQAIWDSF
jgi:DNA-binding transcriptional LysR family regulator